MSRRRNGPPPRASDYVTRFRGTSTDMQLAAEIIVAVVALASVVLVLGLFVWAAIRDGREDKALQARLGTRRRTRL